MAAKSKGYVPNLTFSTPWGMAMLGVIAIIVISLILGVPNDLKNVQCREKSEAGGEVTLSISVKDECRGTTADVVSRKGFLDSNASLMADITVLAYILLLVPMMIMGFLFARYKQFVPHHQVTMTLIVLLNWGLILFIMANSLRQTLDAEGLDSTQYRFLPLLHAAFGFTGQLLGTYLVIRMWFEDSLPSALKIKKIKPLMRLTLFCWLAAATLGIITYVTWYDFGSSAAAPAPASTPEVTQEPEVTATPEATEEVTATPEMTAEADALATPEPEMTAEVEVVATPESTEEMDVVETPESTPESN